jgi:hypothetical protein
MELRISQGKLNPTYLVASPIVKLEGFRIHGFKRFQEVFEAPRSGASEVFSACAYSEQGRIVGR